MFLFSGLGLIPLTTVISYFLSEYSNSNTSYALILALYNIAVNIPKFLISNKINNRKNNYDSILKLFKYEIAIWLTLGLIVIFTENKMLVAILFCIMYLLYACLKGAIDLFYIDLYSKIIPNDSLGKFFGYKYSIISVAEFLAASILIYIITIFNISINYGYIFILVCIFSSFALVTMHKNKKNISRVLEENDYNNQDTKTNVNHISLLKSFHLLKQDSNLKYLIYANIVGIIGNSLAAFYIPYSNTVLTITLEQIALVNFIWLISKTTFSVIWGYIGDKISPKYILVGSRLAILIGYMIAIKLNSLTGFYLLFILYGASNAGLTMMSENIFILIGKEKRTIYTGLNALICLPFFVVTPILINLLTTHLGYITMFKVCIASLVIAIYILLFKFKISTKNI